MARKANKVESAQVAQYVRYHASLLDYGEKMPSIRQMCQIGGYGRSYIEQALTDLVEAEILECRDRSGYYRSQSSLSNNNSEKYIDLFACSVINYLDPKNTFPQNFFSNFMYLAEKAGYKCRIHSVPADKPAAYFEELIRKHSVKIALLFSPNTEDICKCFEFACVRWVAAVPRFSPRFGPAILESDDSVTAMMGFLYEKGHRKIAYIDEFDHDMPAWVFLSRREKYFFFMAKNGLKIEENYYFQQKTKRKEAFALFDKMFSKNPPTAAIVPGGSVLLHLYDYCKKENIVIGKDFSIISFEKRSELKLKLELCSLAYGIKEMSQQSFELLMNKDKNKKNKIEYLDTKIFPGETVADIN